jgi:rhodanese-related sulfurtransferase
MRGYRQLATGIVVWAMWGGLAAVAQQTGNVGEPRVPPRVSIGDFRKMHAAGAVLVVDVRDELAYKGGHIPGAISVPLPDVEARAGDIRAKAKDRLIVTYCSCPSEHSSAAAADVLMAHGVSKVSALVGGLPEWVAKGGKIER